MINKFKENMSCIRSETFLTALVCIYCLWPNVRIEIFLDLGSTTSSGRRSAGFSNVYGDKYGRQGSIIASGKASIASGSLASTGLPIPEGVDTANLTPQQLGVMGE